MKLYDMECPVCGTLNKNIDVEETRGWMECERCGQVTFNEHIANIGGFCRRARLISPAGRICCLIPSCPAGLGKYQTHG